MYVNNLARCLEQNKRTISVSYYSFGKRAREAFVRLSKGSMIQKRPRASGPVGEADLCADLCEACCNGC